MHIGSARALLGEVHIFKVMAIAALQLRGSTSRRVVELVLASHCYHMCEGNNINMKQQIRNAQGTRLAKLKIRARSREALRMDL